MDLNFLANTVWIIRVMEHALFLEDKYHNVMYDLFYWFCRLLSIMHGEIKSSYYILYNMIVIHNSSKFVSRTSNMKIKCLILISDHVTIFNGETRRRTTTRQSRGNLNGIYKYGMTGSCQVLRNWIYELNKVWMITTAYWLAIHCMLGLF